MDQTIKNQSKALEAIQRTNQLTDMFLKNMQELIKTDEN